MRPCFPTAARRLRYIAVGIERSSFHPLEVPQLIEESFDQVLATAAAIADPFEQAFFVMAQLPYLQPFDDLNKRVSRLAANIPLEHIICQVLDAASRAQSKVGIRVADSEPRFR